MNKQTAKTIANGLVAGTQNVAEIFDGVSFCCEDDGMFVFEANPKDEYKSLEGFVPVYAVIGDAKAVLSPDTDGSIANLVRSKKQLH